MTGRRIGARWPRVAAGLLLGLHAALAWFGRAPGILTRQDDALYVVLARSLLQGTYRDLHRIDTALHALYPPGYPAQLAAWGGVFGFGTDTLIVFSLLCSTLALALFWQAVNRIFSPWIAVAALAPLAVNPLLLQYAGSVASEAPYLLLTMIPLWILSRAEQTGRKTSLVVAVVGLVALLTRAVGVAFLAALVLSSLLQRRWRAATILALISATILGGWLTWSSHVSREESAKSYVASMETGPLTAAQASPPAGVAEHLARRVVRHTRFYATEGFPWALAVPTIPGTVIDNVIGLVIVLGTGLVGLVLLCRKWHLAALYLIMYTGVLLVYPWLQARFVVPILPLAVLASLVGGQRLALRSRWKPLQAVVPLGLALILVAGGSLRSIPAVTANVRCDREGQLPDPDCMPPDKASWFEAIRFLQDSIPGDAVFLTAKPEPLFLYTGLRSVATLGTASPPDTAFIPRIRRLGAGYILLGSLQSMEPGLLSRRMLANCDALILERYFPERTYLFRVAPPGSEAGKRESCEAMARYRYANIGRDLQSGL